MATAEQNRRYRQKHPERAREQNRRYRERHRKRLRAERAAAASEVNARRRKRYAEDPDYRTAAMRRSRTRYHSTEGRITIDAYREVNAEKIRATEQRRYKGNSASAARRREKMRIYRANFKTRHPELAARQARERTARRRARKRAARVEKVDRVAIFERDAGLCGLCGGPVDPADWHLDHVVPLAVGGEHSMSNVQVAHPFCNRRKGARADAF